MTRAKVRYYGTERHKYASNLISPLRMLNETGDPAVRASKNNRYKIIGEVDNSGGNRKGRNSRYRYNRKQRGQIIK